MTTPSKLDDTIAFFRTRGSRAVREYDYSLYNSLSQVTYYTKGTDIGVEGLAMPVYAACLLGFSTPLIAETMRRSGFSQQYPTGHFEINGIDDHKLDDGIAMNSVTLFKKIADAMVFMEPDPVELNRILTNAMTRCHSIFSLAVMGLGIEEVNPKTIINNQFDFLASPPEDQALRMPHNVGLVYTSSFVAAELHDVLANIGRVSDLPNSSTLEFLEGSGATLPVVTRKVLGRPFWEEVLLYATCGNQGLHHLVRDFIEHYPNQALATFKSLDFSTAQKTPKLEHFEYLQDMIEAAFSRKGLGSIKSDLSYRLGMLTAYAHEHNGFQDCPISFSADNSDLDEVFYQGISQQNFEEMRDLGPDLTNQLMISQMSIGEDNIGLSNFKAWGWINSFNPVPQAVDSTLFGAYLGYMARSALSFYPKGHETTRDYGDIISEVDAAMERLVDQYREIINYSSLKSMSEDAKLHLVKWGLGVKELEVKRGSTIDLNMAAGLGL